MGLVFANTNTHCHYRMLNEENRNNKTLISIFRLYLSSYFHLGGKVNKCGGDLIEIGSSNQILIFIVIVLVSLASRLNCTVALGINSFKSLGEVVIRPTLNSIPANADKDANKYKDTIGVWYGIV